VADPTHDTATAGNALGEWVTNCHDPIHAISTTPNHIQTVFVAAHGARIVRLIRHFPSTARVMLVLIVVLSLLRVMIGGCLALVVVVARHY